MHKRKEPPALGDAVQPLQPLLLTIPEVAALLGVRRTRVYTLIRREGLPAVSLGGRGGLRVARASLELWVKSRETCGGVFVYGVAQSEAKPAPQQSAKRAKLSVGSSSARSEGTPKARTNLQEHVQM